MRVTETGFKGLMLVETDVFGDSRGWFTETYTKNKFADLGIGADFVQDNQSYSAQKGTLRGIHFQVNPKAQSKLIRCTRGAIADTVVDLRKGSDTYKKWFSVELSADNKKQLFIPKGFGHAFLTLTEDVEVQYKVDEYYSLEHDRSIRFDDPDLDIDWGIERPILSPKDLHAPFLKDSDANFSIKVLVTGAAGQLGSDVVRRLDELGIEGIGADIDDFDITDPEQTAEYVYRINPDVVVHCAAYTAVDKAEDEKEACYRVNVEGTGNIARACQKTDAKMVYISSDYVFAGEGSGEQAEDQVVQPVNYYGLTKAQGEAVVRGLLEKNFIIRTSWIFGRNGNNFVKTMLRLGQSGNRLRVVNDQVGSPTYTHDLAILICDMIQTTEYGTYHGVNEGFCSWYDFAAAIFAEAGISAAVDPVPTSEYPARARRPLNSRLSKANLDRNSFNRLPPWRDALVRYLHELQND